MMDKLLMCRICLVQNVRMNVVVNKSLHELYEKLTDIPFVTEDRRPVLVCFYCCAKLKQSFRLLRKCLEADELFSQMMNEDYEPNPSMKINHLEHCSGFSKTEIELISVVDGCRTESIAIKEELPDICERQDDVIEPKEEYQSDDLELGRLHNTCLEVSSGGISSVEDIAPHLSDSEDNVPLMEFTTELEEGQEITSKKRRAVESNRAPVTKKPKLDARRIKQEDTLTAELMKNEQSNLKVIRTTIDRTSKRGSYLKESYKSDQHSSNRLKKSNQHTRSGICEEPYKCDICQCKFREKGYLTTHIRRHTGEQPYKCEVCMRSFNQKSHLTEHNIRIHTREKSYKCEVCTSTFIKKDALKKHIRTHTSEKPYKCEECQRSFNQKGHFTDHIRIHTGEKPYKCHVCQRGFSEKGSLTKHIRIHTGEKPYKCEICMSSFIKKDDLKKHIRRHTGEKPYKCELCMSSFIKKDDLKKHIRTHTGEKPYKCHVCQRGFSEKGSLTNHIRTHTGEKPYKCHVCQRGFSVKGSLTKHIRIHTGEKPYNCEECQRGFTRKVTMIKHIQTHTGEKQRAQNHPLL